MKSKKKENKLNNNNQEIEIYENFETNDKDEEFLKNKKISKNKRSKLKYNKFLLFILLNILIITVILFIIYLIFYNNNIIISNSYESNRQNEKINTQEINIKYVHTINNTNEYYTIYNGKKEVFPFNSLSQFPSGNLISTDSLSIFIYDNNYNILQKIPVFEVLEGFRPIILYLDVKDDDNFAIGCNEQSIKIYTREGDIFKLKQDIKNAHDRGIIKVIYNSRGNIISGSYDRTIKIWEKNNEGDYINTKIINNKNDEVRSLLLLEDKNILISCGERYTNLWDISNDYKLIKTFNETYCRAQGVLERISDDKIAVAKSPFFLKIISLTEIKVIKVIELEFGFTAIKFIKDKGLFLVGGFRTLVKGGSSTIKVFRNDNFEIIKTIYDVHKDAIKGFHILQNGLIGSFSFDYVINIWSLKLV